MTDRVAYPRHPAHIDDFVDVLGPALTVTFLVEMGGCRMYFPNDPKGKSLAESVIGAEALRELSRRMPSNRRELPLPKDWLIRALHAEGKSPAEICRILKTTDRNVRETLASPGLPEPVRALPPIEDLPLFRLIRDAEG
ncbi:helix-turn-helix domain-containing protein [Sagittula sp. S175]|uniref:helix-turn-helix domain-containing protein n=1 Tax=Sagittula sp. S175 TaxID=3415129 RepID=UPI003C7A769E